MALGTHDDYCSFTKAVEHLGDRWSLLIVRELAMAGPQGFNALATGLPGHISRSVLTDKLHKLEDLGLISRQARSGRTEPYRLTSAGEALIPTLLSLRDWAEAWMPDDPAMVERDPEIIWGWLANRIDPVGLPVRQTIVAITMRREEERRSWIVLQKGIEPYGCLEDPLLDEDRYVYVEAGLAVLLSLARGHRSWRMPSQMDQCTSSAILTSWLLCRIGSSMTHPPQARCQAPCRKLVSPHSPDDDARRARAEIDEHGAAWVQMRPR